MGATYRTPTLRNGNLYNHCIKRRNLDTTISRTIMDWEPVADHHRHEAGTACRELHAAISLHDSLTRTIHYYQG
ncbi:hypothetical protein DN757_29005 [Paenibacillus silvae]|uniref:Uncharacterized protein n=1 Tax=Paenibacillus silvae TaxID=1325358 RepID=A0A2W6N878_9BACL|nr:hypothetical protein DN757_29005 [Paenibacillus silvae]